MLSLFIVIALGMNNAKGETMANYAEVMSAQAAFQASPSPAIYFPAPAPTILANPVSASSESEASADYATSNSSSTTYTPSSGQTNSSDASLVVSDEADQALVEATSSSQGPANEASAASSAGLVPPQSKGLPTSSLGYVQTPMIDCGLALPIGKPPVVQISDVGNGAKQSISTDYHYDGNLIVQELVRVRWDNKVLTKMYNNSPVREFQCSYVADKQSATWTRTMPTSSNYGMGTCSWSAWKKSPVRHVNSKNSVTYQEDSNRDFRVRASINDYSDDGFFPNANRMSSYYRYAEAGFDGDLSFKGLLKDDLMGGTYEEASVEIDLQYYYVGLAPWYSPLIIYDKDDPTVVYDYGYEWFKKSGGVKTVLASNPPHSHSNRSVRSTAAKVRARIGEPTDDGICRANLNNFLYPSKN